MDDFSHVAQTLPPDDLLCLELVVDGEYFDGLKIPHFYARINYSNGAELRRILLYRNKEFLFYDRDRASDDNNPHAIRSLRKHATEILGLNVGSFAGDCWEHILNYFMSHKIEIRNLEPKHAARIVTRLVGLCEVLKDRLGRIGNHTFDYKKQCALKEWFLYSDEARTLESLHALDDLCRKTGNAVVSRYEVL